MQQRIGSFREARCSAASDRIWALLYETEANTALLVLAEYLVLESGTMGFQISASHTNKYPITAYGDVSGVLFMQASHIQSVQLTKVIAIANENGTTEYMYTTLTSPRSMYTIPGRYGGAVYALHHNFISCETSHAIRRPWMF